MGYVAAVSACVACHQPFSYNPVKVPSIRVNGTRHPICQECVDMVNPLRIAGGLEPIVPHPEAYLACDEGELDV